MEEALKSIITLEKNAHIFVDTDLLLKHTRRITDPRASQNRWYNAKHLHLIGENAGALCAAPPGTYVDNSGHWILIAGADTRKIRKRLARCGTALETLCILKTDIAELDVHNLTSLKTLAILDNSALQEIQGLQHLRQLETLILQRTPVRRFVIPAPLAKLQKLNMSYNYQLEEIDGLENLPALEHLNLNLAPVSKIHISAPLHKVTCIEAAFSSVDNLNFLHMTPHVKELWLGRKSTTDLSVVQVASELHTLALLDVPEFSLDDMCLPDSLEELYILNSTFSILPESIKRLPNLKYLDLVDVKMERLPDWLPELGLTIGRSPAFGINLSNAAVEGIDMSIFDQSQDMIQQWFEERKSGGAKPLNELKVVFLGDGGAGKSRTIARLLLDGANTEDFPNVSTPGIVIQDRDYDLGDRTVKVHFWDFGGQDILHSMHRMFLTERTLYVVMLNVRDGTQTERGRYWLHNIRSFAKGAPVLIVLNQIDTNRNASVNQPDLRSMYPELTEVIAMSALEDDAASVQDNLIAALKRQIGAFPTLESPFLPAWSRLKDALGDMEDYYINGDAFAKLCAECGVEDDETIRLALLKWFSDLGVSFHYNSSAKLRDYVILRPDWITNAIYTIIFNKSKQVKNGLISHEAIYELLSSDSREIRRAIPEMTYQPREVDYVLDVVRKFRLSFRVGDDSEFIPMLCQADSLPVAAEYEADPHTLEFRMEYEYLPNNVLHRLMVDLRRDLDTSQVWLTGALFRQTSNGLSAVVKTEGDILRIFVRGDDPLHRPHTYLNTIRDALGAIHRDMGLAEPESFIVYKKDGRSEEFLYDSLQGSLDSGLTSIYSRVMRRAIPILDILDQSDREVARKKKKLLDDVADACLQLQGKKIMWGASEDDRNTELRDALHNKGYDVADQSLMGVGAGRKNAGEVDLLIRSEQRQPWMICEAMNITGAGNKQLDYWDAHLNKLLLNYNPQGLQDLILISYVEADADKFSSLWSTYSEHMRWYDPPEVLRRNGTYRALPERYNCLRTARCTYDRGGMPTTVHHYFLRMGL